MLKGWRAPHSTSMQHKIKLFLRNTLLLPSDFQKFELFVIQGSCMVHLYTLHTQNRHHAGTYTQFDCHLHANTCSCTQHEHFVSSQSIEVHALHQAECRKSKFQASFWILTRIILKIFILLEDFDLHKTRCFFTDFLKFIFIAQNFKPQ